MKRTLTSHWRRSLRRWEIMEYKKRVKWSNKYRGVLFFLFFCPNKYIQIFCLRSSNASFEVVAPFWANIPNRDISEFETLLTLNLLSSQKENWWWLRMLFTSIQQRDDSQTTLPYRATFSLTLWFTHAYLTGIPTTFFLPTIGSGVNVGEFFIRSVSIRGRCIRWKVSGFNQLHAILNFIASLFPRVIFAGGKLNL